MSPSLWRAAVAAAAVLAVSGVAYVRTTAGNVCLYWGTRQVSYLVNDFSVNGAQEVCGSTTDAAAVQAVVQASFDAWTAAGGQLSCTDLQLLNAGGSGGLTSSTHTGYDQQNIVVWRAGPCTSLAPAGDPCFASHTCGDTYNCWDTSAPNHGDSKIIALTTVTYSTRTGQIFDADMELNAANAPLGTGLPTSAGFYFTCGPTTNVCTTLGQAACVYMDVQNTVTHEAGHFIGFAHNTADSASTMYPTAPIGDTSKRTLAAEDKQGVCDVYPIGKPPLTCGTNSSGCGCGTTGAEGVLGLAAVLLAFGRRRPGTGTTP